MTRSEVKEGKMAIRGKNVQNAKARRERRGKVGGRGTYIAGEEPYRQ